MADILLVQYGGHGFLRRDQKLIETEFSTEMFEFRQPPLHFVADTIHFFLWVRKRRKNAYVIFTRFADYHAFVSVIVAKLFRKSFVIVLGGYDAVWMPRFNFGVYRKWKSRVAATYAIRHADYVLPVDESLVRGVNLYSDPEPRREGILEYVSNIRGRIATIHNGYDPATWKVPEGITKLEEFLTVANVSTYVEWVRKGINYFVLLARALPDYRFRVVGMTPKILKQFLGEMLPNNLIVEPALQQQELVEAYSRAKVYVQLSLSEGMPNCLCESMLCECVPVGSNVNGIPRIIGDTGFIVFKQDLAEMKQQFLLAVKSNTGKKARQRIIEGFPPERRRDQLNAIFRELIVSAKNIRGTH